VLARQGVERGHVLVGKRRERRHLLRVLAGPVVHGPPEPECIVDHVVHPLGKLARVEPDDQRAAGVHQVPWRLTTQGPQHRIGEVVIRQARARVHQPSVVAVTAGQHQPVVAAAGALSADDRGLPLVGEGGDAHMMPPDTTVDMLAEPCLQPERRRPQQPCDLDAHQFLPLRAELAYRE
jgi:hypothetical protein